MQTTAQPVVTVRFANPGYDSITQVYDVDVEFQCNTAGKQLFGMNVRFYYNDLELEFISFGEFITGYGAISPNPPGKSTGTAAAGATYFGFDGPPEYINGAIQKLSTSSVTLPTTGWVKIFNMSFQAEPGALTGNYCPSLVWNLNEAGTGGLLHPQLVMTVVNGTGSASAIPAVVQYNWDYDGITGNPFGYPVEENCLVFSGGLAPSTTLPLVKIVNPGAMTVPVTVNGFTNIYGFNLAFNYDPAAMTYVSYVPNSAFGSSLVVTDSPCMAGLRRITMSYTGNSVTLDDFSILADINFLYDTVTGPQPLSWITDGTSCQYFGQGYILLEDEPYELFYYSGSAELLVAPVTRADTITAIVNEYVTFAVRVWGYQNISSGFLTVIYDTDKLTYYNTTSSGYLNGSFQAAMTIPGTIEMQWSGSPMTLPDASALAYMTFIYSGGDASLNWLDNGISCQYIDGSLNLPLFDNPFGDYYRPGSVTQANFIWTGETSNDWYNSANWINNIVPDQFTNVTIDPAFSRSVWPAFTGDFTVGVQCKNLTLNGNAQFIVTGGFTINPGTKFEMTGPGILQLGGSWVNSGTFLPGTGMVEFTGDNNASINFGVDPSGYVAAYKLDTFTAGMVPLVSGNAGPTGDNAHSDVSIGFNFVYLGVSYSQVRINTNGWMSFELMGDDETSWDNTLLFEPIMPVTVVAPWWDDLLADGTSAITYKTEGTAPNRVFTVQWKDLLSFHTGSTSRLNFQAKLYETTHTVEFHYGNINTGSFAATEGASIGIKDATGGPGRFIEATHASINLALPTLKAAFDWPEVNYRFTPPVASNLEEFNRVLVSKVNGELVVQKDTRVVGVE